MIRKLRIFLEVSGALFVVIMSGGCAVQLMIDVLHKRLAADFMSGAMAVWFLLSAYAGLCLAVRPLPTRSATATDTDPT